MASEIACALGLVSRVVPHAGESLMSLIVRAADENVLGRPERIMAIAGIETLRPEYVQFTRWDAAPNLARLLGTDEAAIFVRMHPAVIRTGGDFVDWYGTPLPRRWIRSRHMHYSPQALARGPFHRAIWSLKPLGFCPETGRLLRDGCGACGSSMAWASLKSVARCSSCHADLTIQTNTLLDPKLLNEACEVAHLISPDARVREKVLRSCPAPFADWEAGDVFQAVVELGLISKDPIAPPHCSLAKSMFRGNFTGYSAEHLVAGYRFVLGWPQSLEQHLRAVTRGRSGPMATFLGRLGRYFTQGAADTPIRRLMQETVAPTLGRLNTPRKSNHIARHLRNPDTLNTSEAALRFDADKKVISRLAASSVCCIAKGTGPNGPQLFHAPYVEAAFNRWRGAVDVTKAAHLLGAPPYCIPAFIGAGFLQQETDADAILLAQGERLVTLASIRSLAKAIQNKLNEHASIGDPVPFRRAMIGVLDPTSWTKAVSGLLNGEIPVLGTRPFDSRALDSVMVSRDAFLGIRKADEKLSPLDVTVSASEAASLLGVSNTLVSGAVKLCLVRGYWGKAQVDVPLSEVRRWRQTFVGSQEVRELTGLSSQRLSALMRDRGIKPLGEAYNTKFWDRRRVSSALGVDLFAI